MSGEYTNTVELLSLSHKFKSSMSMLYTDLQTVIKESYGEKITRENWWNIGNIGDKINQDWILQYHFRLDKKVFGVSLILGADKKRFSTEDYKKMLNSISVDAHIPLLLLYGVFEPIDTEQYSAKDWWSLCLGYSNWSKAILPENYTLKDEISIETEIGPESYYWFSSARYKLCSIFEKGVRFII